jgi:hypothetical protein
MTREQAAFQVTDSDNEQLWADYVDELAEMTLRLKRLTRLSYSASPADPEDLWLADMAYRLSVHRVDLAWDAYVSSGADRGATVPSGA